MTLIAFTGSMGSGKTTAAAALVSNGFAYLRFAYPLKEMIFALMVAARVPTDKLDYYMTEAKEEPIPELGNNSARYLMQTLGTEWGRQTIHEDFWVKILESRYQVYQDEGKTHFVIDDLRFENEAQWVISRGGHIIRIIRNPEEAIASHVSESGIMQLPYNAVIQNNKSLQEFREEIRATVRAYGGMQP